MEWKKSLFDIWLSCAHFDGKSVYETFVCLWMLWKRKLSVQYWTRFESTRDDWLRELSPRYRRTHNTLTDYFITFCVDSSLWLFYTYASWRRYVCAFELLYSTEHLNNNLNWNIGAEIKRKVHYHLHNSPFRVCFHWVKITYYSFEKDVVCTIYRHLCTSFNGFEMSELLLLIFYNVYVTFSYN